ncbi:MAG: hypothetical protein JW785_01565 [Acidimicrobiia bacterium]|nr:hypothetical protein [Acidimicrobiia bacterium]
MRRVCGWLLPVLITAACGSGGNSVFTAPVTTAPATTSSSAPTDATGVETTSTTVVPPSSSSTTVPPVESAAPVVWQIVQRWEGRRPLGSFEATVCNLGASPATGLEALIAANGVEARIALPEVPPRWCVDAYDPESSFTTFGVTAGQTVAVRAVVRRNGEEIHSREQAVTVSLMSAEPSVEVLEAYDWCRTHNDPEHGFCTPYDARAAWDDPHEVMKQLDRYLVVVPAVWEPLAALTLADMGICLPSLEAYLGMTLPAHTVPLLWRFAESEDRSLFAAGGSIIHVLPKSLHFYEGILSGGFPQHSWESVFSGRCSEAHETTHMMMDMVRGLPTWLNEGLAVYLSHRDRTNWYVDQDLMRCEEAGYVDINEFTGEETFIPYVALGPDPGAGPYGEYYATGACFWDYFEKAYGHQAFLLVMDALEATRDSAGGPIQGCPKFLDLVTPVIGEDISALTQERFGFGPDYSLCSVEG